MAPALIHTRPTNPRASLLDGRQVRIRTAHQRLPEPAGAPVPPPGARRRG